MHGQKDSACRRVTACDSSLHAGPANVVAGQFYPPRGTGIQEFAQSFEVADREARQSVVPSNNKGVLDCVPDAGEFRLNIDPLTFGSVEHPPFFN